jgi:hypothetical protein
MAGCGGESPSSTDTIPSPSPTSSAFPPGSVLSVLSGYDGTPVAGADVRVGTTALRSDASGRVVLPQGATPGVTLEVTAQDFLARRTQLTRAEDLAVFLWPAEIRSIGLDQEMTKLLLHERLEAPGTLTPDATHPAGTTEILLWPDDALRGDPRAMAALGTAVERLAAAFELRFQVVDRQPAAGFVIVIRQGTLETRCISCAFTRTGSNSWELIGGDVFIGSAGALHPGLWIHEIGHVLGSTTRRARARRDGAVAARPAARLQRARAGDGAHDDEAAARQALSGRRCGRDPSSRSAFVRAASSSATSSRPRVSS